MSCRGTGHQFSALGCGQATKIVIRRGDGSERCVGGACGVENRQGMSPSSERRLVGQVSAPHPAGGLPRWALTGRASNRASLRIPIQQGLVLRERRVNGEEIRIPTWQGPPAGSIAQSSHRASVQSIRSVCPSHPVGGCRVGRAFSRAGLPGVGEHPRPDANWSADENLDNFGAGAVN